MKKHQAGLISVIITTYKRDDSVLKRAIDSVKAQTYRPVELIVVNDDPSSEARIRALLAAYEDVRFLSNPVNMGACASRNAGIRVAQGEYVAFLDDDDEWLADKLTQQQRMLASVPEAGMVYCGQYIVRGDTVRACTYICPPQKDIVKQFAVCNFAGGCSGPLLTRAAVDKVGLFDTAFPSAQDYDYWLRIAMTCPVLYCDQQLVLYHMENERISTDYRKRYEGWKLFLKKHRGVYAKYKNEKVMFCTKAFNMLFAGGKYAWAATFFWRPLDCTYRCWPLWKLMVSQYARLLAKAVKKRIRKRT